MKMLPAKMCAECNITFAGPSSEVISSNGGIKPEARKQMIAGQCTAIPGSDDVVETVEEGNRTRQAWSASRFYAGGCRWWR